MAKIAKAQFNADHLRIASAIMRALAHPLRLRIISMLQDCQPASVRVIYTKLKVEQSVASQHLRILREADLVQTQRQGKFVEYLLNTKLLLQAGLTASTLASTKKNEPN